MAKANWNVCTVYKICDHACDFAWSSQGGTNQMIRICIPTFNRWDRLKTQIGLLNAALRLGARFTVDILDNVSTDRTVEALIASNLPDNIKVLTHTENVGFEGNVARILAHSARWVEARDHLWILSDDDFVNPVALTILPSAWVVYTAWKKLGSVYAVC